VHLPPRPGVRLVRPVSVDVADTSMVKEDWHLSKSVPISLIVALIIQGGAIVWTVSQMQSDIDGNTQDIARLDARVELIRDSMREQAIQLGRIDERLQSIDTSLITIRESLSR